MGKAVVHRAYIGESAARIAHGEFRAGRTLEEEQARVALVGVGGLFRFGINIVKNGFAVQGAIAQGVHNLHGFVRVDVAIPRQAQIAQRIAAEIARVHRKEQPPVIAEGGIVDHRLNGRISIKHFRLRSFRMSGSGWQRQQGDCRQHPAKPPECSRLSHAFTPSFVLAFIIRKARLQEKSRFIHERIPLGYISRTALCRQPSPRPEIAAQWATARANAGCRRECCNPIPPG